MLTKKPSAKSPNGSKARRKKHTPLGESIIKGMEELQAHMKGEIKLRIRAVYIPADVDVAAIREKTGLSQSKFAEQYGFNPRTLQDWEQGRVKPDSAVRAYLTVISRDPGAVEKALHG